MSSYPTASLADSSIDYNPFPSDEGPRALPVPLDFSAQANWTLNLTQVQQRGMMATVQSFYADNRANAAALNVTVAQTQQTVSVAAGAQGYYPLLCPQPAQLVLSSSGGVAGVLVILLNIPMNQSQWFPASGAPNFANGRMQVSDPALDAVVQNAAANVNPQATGTGGVFYPAWVGNVAAVAGITNSAAAIITGAPGYFVTAAKFSLSAAAAQAAAGDLTVSLVDSSTGTIFEFDLWLPGTSPTPAQGSIVSVETPASWRWNNKVAASTLGITLSAALTAGRLYYNLSYGITPITG